jgi:hypothetical protein
MYTFTTKQENTGVSVQIRHDQPGTVMKIEFRGSDRDTVLDDCLAFRVSATGDDPLEAGGNDHYEWSSTGAIDVVKQPFYEEFHFQVLRALPFEGLDYIAEWTDAELRDRIKAGLDAGSEKAPR